MARYPWLRLHTEIVDDAKLADFTGDEFRFWIFLLCMARENDSEPGIIVGDANSIAWRTRHDVSRVQAALDKFQARNMIETEEGLIIVTNFDSRQYDRPSDKPTNTRARKQRSRARHDESRAGHDTEERRGEKKQSTAPPAQRVPPRVETGPERAAKGSSPTPKTASKGYAEIADAWSDAQNGAPLVGSIRTTVDELLDAGFKASAIIDAIHAMHTARVDGRVKLSPVGVIRKLVEETPTGEPMVWQGEQPRPSAKSRVAGLTAAEIAEQAREIERRESLQPVLPRPPAEGDA